MLQSLSFDKDARPFVIHFLFVIFSVIGIIWFIDPPGENDHLVYNLNHRRPHFTAVDGSPRVAGIRNLRPLQSDMTTTLSLLASATRAAAAWWAGKLLWRCAFMFMERSEITLTGFSKVISGGITTLLSSHDVLSRKNWLLVYAIIFICFAMDYFSAFLTGSVTWQPAFTLVDGVVPLLNLTEGIPGSNLEFYRRFPANVLLAIDVATSLAMVSWGTTNMNSSNLSVPSNLARRALFQAGGFQAIQYLPPNSTVESIQLPYFKVEQFEFITNPELTLTSQQLSLLNVSSLYNPYLQGGWVALLPDASWGPGSSLSLPPPVKVSNSQILSAVVGLSNIPSCSIFSNSSSAIPPEVHAYPTFIAITSSHLCIIFANVTYTAGAAICQNCKVVSPTVVQGNISNLQPLPDPLTIEALAITSSVMALINSNPFLTPVGLSQDSLIESVSLAYQCAWASLASIIGDVGRNNQTSVMIAIPASHPNVLRWRVYLWAVLHIVVLLFGIAFIGFESPSHPWVSDPVTAAFLLDTTEIFKQGEAADSGAMNPWHPDAKLPAGMLKINDYDPSRPGKPRTVELIPTRRTSHSSHEQLDGESDSMLLTQIM